MEYRICLTLLTAQDQQWESNLRLFDLESKNIQFGFDLVLFIKPCYNCFTMTGLSKGIRCHERHHTLL